MASVSLYDYLESISQLLDEERYAEVERHCRHILSQYPQHIETYRLLARSFLGQMKYTAAIDLLQRVLSADPNDFIAHIALSDAYRGEGRTELALRHLERAYELSPYKSTVQEEMRRVYAEVGETKMVTERLTLTPAAAAHLYLRGDLFHPAISILQGALQEAPERVELQLMLAEAQWRSGNRVEAASLSKQILDVLPDSIVANAILSEVWHGSAREMEAMPYLRRLQSLTLVDRQHLDLETAVGLALVAHGPDLLPDELMIEALDISKDGDLTAVLDAEWVGDVLPKSPAAESVESDEDMYGWLSGVPEDVPETAEQPDEVEELEDDWFAEPALQEQGAGSKAAQSVADWLQDEWEAPEPVELPEAGITEPPESAADWLQNEGEPHDDLQQAVMEEDDDDYLRKPSPALSASDAGLEAFWGRESDDEFSDIEESDIPSWLAADIESEGVIESRPAEKSAEDSMPDWLAQITSTDFDAVQLDPTSASDWLSGEVAAEDEPAAELDDGLESDDETADWLASLSGHIDEVQEAEAEAGELGSDWLLAESEPENGAWLQQTDEPAGAESAADWLAEIAGDDDEVDWSDEWLEDETAVAPVEEQALPSETDWLAELSQGTEEAAEAGDWLAELAMNAADSANDEQVETPESQPTPVDVPAAAAGEPEADLLSPLDDALAADEEDWLAGLSTGLTDELAEAMADWSDSAGQEAEEAEDWLLDLAGDTTDELVTGEATSEDETAVEELEDLEDWLAELSRPTSELSSLDVEEKAPDELRAAEDAVDELGLAQLTGEEQPETSPGWLQEETSRVEEVEAERMGIQDENDMPEQKKTPEPDEKEGTQEQPEDFDWLDSLTSLENEEDEGDEIPAELAKVDLPDWLYESNAALEEEAADDIDVPDWLLESTSDLLNTAETIEPTEDDLMFALEEELGLPDETSDEWDVDLSTDFVAEEEPVESPEAVDDLSVSLPDELRLDELETGEGNDLAWLEQLADEEAEEESVPALDWLEDLETDEVQEEADTAVSPTAALAESIAEDDLFEGEDEEEDFLAVPADLDDAMSWLEDLAAEQDTPIEPLPTVADVLDDEPEAVETLAEMDLSEPAAADETAAEAPSTTAFDEAMTDLDDTLSWLDDLTEEAGALDEASLDFLANDLEEPETPGVDEEAVQDELISDAEPTPDIITDVPEDLEEAMAWLESLAARQGASLDELPSLSQQEAPEIEAVDEVVEDVSETAELDAALAEELDWLEAIAFGEEMPEDAAEQLSIAQTSDDELSDALDRLAQMALPDEDEAPESDLWEEEAPETAVSQALAAEEQEGVEDFDAIFDIPDDPDEAMAWLQEFAAEEAEEMVEAPQDLPALRPEDVLEEEVSAETADYDDAPIEDFLADVPEDPDEAMAWLEQLAARQGASLDELPTVTEVPEEVETPPWVASAAKAAAEELPAGDAETEAGDDLDLDSLLDEVDDFAETFDFPLPDEEEEAPEWLSADAPEETVADEQLGQDDWLDTLPEMDVTGWLESEDAVSTTTGGDTGPLPQTGPLFEAKPATSPLPELDEADEQEEVAEEEAVVASVLQVDEEQLMAARAALASGDSQNAAATYQQLVAKGEGLMMLIGELETAVSQHQKEPAFRRLLGDAYMRNGQLQKALSTYRDALDQL